MKTFTFYWLDGKRSAFKGTDPANALSSAGFGGGGSISKGEQRFLEQIGVNPTKMQSILREFVKEIESQDDISVVQIHKFICDTADGIIKSGAVEKKAELFGVKPHQDNSFMFLDRIGTRKQLEGPVDEGDVEGFPFGGIDD